MDLPRLQACSDNRKKSDRMGRSICKAWMSVDKIVGRVCSDTASSLPAKQRATGRAREYGDGGRGGAVCAVARPSAPTL